MEKLNEKALSLGITLNEVQMNQFQKYFEFLVEKNKVMNLTGITEKEEVIDKHFIDSIMLNQVFDLSGNISIMDMGTGAGFPGVPLKIAFPKLSVTLMDSLNKRILFLDDVIKLLGLSDVNTIHGRAEDYAKKGKLRECYDLCVSRAVANLASLSEYCIPYVKKGGYFISYKAGESDEEIKEAQNAIKTLGGKMEEVKKIKIPGTDIERTFVVIRKCLETPNKYPRKAGQPTKNPIR